jgi:hypothetical protein
MNVGAPRLARTLRCKPFLRRFVVVARRKLPRGDEGPMRGQSAAAAPPTTPPTPHAPCPPRTRHPCLALLTALRDRRSMPQGRGCRWGLEAARRSRAVGRGAEEAGRRGGGAPRRRGVEEAGRRGLSSVEGGRNCHSCGVAAIGLGGQAVGCASCSTGSDRRFRRRWAA